MHAIGLTTLHFSSLILDSQLKKEKKTVDQSVKSESLAIEALGDAGELQLRRSGRIAGAAHCFKTSYAGAKPQNYRSS
jgi:hypothetical protein